MAVMLDTCGLLSLVGLADRRLSVGTRKKIEIADTVYISACSLLELAIKHKKRKLNLGVFPDAITLWQQAIAEYDLVEIPVTGKAFFASSVLPDLHADPFDRIIIAQSKALQVPVVSFDDIFMTYGLMILY